MVNSKDEKRFIRYKKKEKGENINSFLSKAGPWEGLQMLIGFHQPSTLVI